MVTAALPFQKQSTQAAGSVSSLLHHTFARLVLRKDVGEAIAELVTGLGAFWQGADRDQWSEVVALCQQHPVYSLIGQDPFTHRARTKPRGYAGDAVMIDYIYRGLPDAGDATTGLGREIFQYTAGLSRSARSVRARRDLLAARIDATAERVDRPRILAVACGHLREAALSHAVANRSVGALCALDQDRESLALVGTEYGHMPEVEVVAGSVRDILKGNVRVDGYDLIYAAGLYDYLPQPVARSLTTKLAAGLTSGGELLLGNFLPAPSCVGYMEALMDWSLVWRTEAELADLAAGIPESDVAAISGFVDSDECIAYLEIVRR